MRLMLTSFGAGYGSVVGSDDSDLSAGISTGDVASRSLFDRMPPVDMGGIDDRFIPPYALLLLCEKLIVDTKTLTI
jgi:hypothetical protein